MTKWLAPILISLGLIGLLYFGWRHFQKPAPEQTLSYPQKSDDLNALTNPNANEKQIFDALNRMSSNTDSMKEARSFALQLKDNPSTLVLEAVAETLSYFNDEESEAILKALLSHRHPSVRMRVIQGLPHAKSEFRKELLATFLKGRPEPFEIAPAKESLKLLTQK